MRFDLGSKENYYTSRTIFVFFLALSYLENMFFFTLLVGILKNPLLSILLFFTHNVLVISLILLGMTFYVNLVLLNFFKGEKYANIILEHPRPFAITFTIMIIFLSILRGSSLISGTIIVEYLPLILLLSAPQGIIEGYGIYLTLKKTLSRTMALKDLAFIYALFFIAALMEVGFINLMTFISYT